VFLSLTTKIWPDMFRLDNMIIIVAGAGLIGSIIIKALAEAGAIVIMADINEENGIRLAEDYKNKNLNVIFKKLDITNEKSIDKLLDFCTKEFNKLDAWVNVSYPRTSDWGTKEQLTNYPSFIQNLNMHLGGYYITSIKAAEKMKELGGGCIVNFGSTYGITAPDFSIYEGTDMTNAIPYAAIKGGINMLTKYIATYYGKDNIRANVIAPGGVFDNQQEPFLSKYNKKVPLNRMAKPEEIAGPVLFLVSKAASYITGHILIVDGGWTTW